jgi:hypothetical protein
MAADGCGGMARDFEDVKTGRAEFEAESGGILQVVIDIAWGSDHGGDAGRFIRDAMRGVRQTAKLVWF